MMHSHASLQHFTMPSTYTVEGDESVSDTVFRHSSHTPELVLFQRNCGDVWVDVTAAEFARDVYAFATEVLMRGVQAGDRVGLWAETSYEWLICAEALWAVGVVIVPLYPTASTKQVQSILEGTEASYLVVDTQERHLQVQKTEYFSRLRHCWVSDGVADMAASSPLNCAEVDARRSTVTANNLALIVFTSGTTGQGKGVCLTHANMLHEVRAIGETSLCQQFIKPGRRALTVLPLAHVFALSFSLTCIENGATQACWADPSTMLVQLQRFSPHFIVAVPRLVERIVERLWQLSRSAEGMGEEKFLQAYRAAVSRSRTFDETYPHGVANRSDLEDSDSSGGNELRAVEELLRTQCGGQLDTVISGGGPLGTQMAHFLRGAGLPVFEGYGLTETAAAFTVNNPGACRIGSVGQPLPGCTVTISVDGELLLQGGMLSEEYWNNFADTRDAFANGWFHTGDLGCLDDDGFVYITGRKKDIIVTSGGKSISPAMVEGQLLRSPLIAQAVVIGDRKKFVSCLITLRNTVVHKWLLSRGEVIPDVTSPEFIPTVRTNPLLLAEIEKTIAEVNTHVSRAEAIKEFRILHRSLTEDEGEVTATLKVKRHVVELHFHDEIDSIYGIGGGVTQPYNLT